ncbi:MAG: aldehyde dehydrogenase, partial [Bacteroidales bacterium]|nr:aldehyde dehydrogenase [Bacteroidales bacterium]
RKALREMQGVPYRDGGAVLFEEGAASPGIGSVSYAVYDDRSQAEAWIAAADPEAWQCIVGEGDGLVPFGQAQRPTLTDYADGVSIPAFLKENFAI